MFNKVFPKAIPVVLLLIVLSLASSLKSNAQIQVLEYPCRLDFFKVDEREVLAIPDNDESEFAFILADNSKIIAQLTDKNFKLHQKLVFDKPGGSFKNLIGHFYSEPFYNLVFANKKRTKIQIVNIDFKKKKLQHHVAGKIRPVREEILAHFAYKGNYYFLTIRKNSSKVNLHRIGLTGEVTKNQIDISSYLPSGSGSLYQQIFKNPRSVHLDDVSFVVPEIHENIRATSVKTKIYLYKDQLVITNDKNPDYTSLIRINMDDLKVNYKPYPSSWLSGIENKDANSASYFLNNNLYQMKTSPEGMQFLIRNLTNDSIVKKIQTGKEDVIEFKNTPFIVSVEDREFERYFTKTPKILKKISRNETGISVFEATDAYFITFGSYKPVPRGGGFVSGMSGDVVMGPSFSISWTVNKDSYFESVFDKNLNHLSGRKYFEGIKGGYEFISIFDRILHFEENITGYPVVTTLFWFNDKYYYGYYKDEEKKYYLHEFVEYPLVY